MAWIIPPIWKDLETGKISAPVNSKVLAGQKQLAKATQATLDAVYRDVREGLLETVGVDCELVIDDRCSVALNLPEGTDTELIARAIDLENVEAWRDAEGKVNVGISPWYSVKDVDQTVLSAIKTFTFYLAFTLPTRALRILKQSNRNYSLRLRKFWLSKKTSSGKNNLRLPERRGLLLDFAFANLSGVGRRRKTRTGVGKRNGQRFT